MFDIGFSELVLIFIVGLVVLGPQRLPVAIRTVMGWIRTIRGLAHNVQTELAQELKLQELQESIKKAEQLNLSQLSPELSKTVADLKESASKMQSALDSAKGSMQALTQEQVADIQQRIEQESQTLSAQTNESESLQHFAENQPLTSHPEDDLTAEDIAAVADMDESELAQYYPPDDPTLSEEQLNEERTNVS